MKVYDHIQETDHDYEFHESDYDSYEFTGRRYDYESVKKMSKAEKYLIWAALIIMLTAFWVAVYFGLIG